LIDTLNATVMSASRSVFR